MKILISGATGFIGTHLINRLIETKLAGRLSQIIGLTRQSKALHGDVTWVHSPDLREASYYAEALQGVDAIVHLAAAVHSRKLSSAQFTTLNVDGTLSLAAAALQAGVPHFIFLSSIAAVTQSSSTPITLSTPYAPVTPYGKSKLEAEVKLYQLANPSSMALTVLRPTVVYGSGDPGNIGRLVRLCRTGLPLPFGSINNKRSFLYVENLADAICTCLIHPGAKNATFLVSDPTPLSTPDLIRHILAALGKPDKLWPFPIWGLRALGLIGACLERLSGQPTSLSSAGIDKLTESLIVDSSYIQDTLSWQPTFGIEAGLRKWLST